VRRGAAISGAMHAALLALALFGADWFRDREPIPFELTEIEMIDGTELDARLSTAPVVQSEGPAEMSPPAPGDSAPAEAQPPDAAAEATAVAALDTAPAPEPRPDAPEVTIPPPPTEIPTEAPAPSIAEIPSPDPLDSQAPEPESPASTEPVQPLASVKPPVPTLRPLPPPEPEPDAQPTPEPAQATAPDPEAPEPPKPEPEPAAEPEPEAVAEAQIDAPESLAPREARLPVARPAEVARAARAASRQDPAPRQAETEPEEPKPAEQRVAQAEAKPKPAANAGGSTRPSGPLNEGEKDALRLGIKKFYTYSGRQDPTLRVTIRLRLDEQAQIDGKPELLRAEGGDQGSQKSLFDAGRRALLQAQNAGEFKKLPADKYGAWQVLNVVFTTEKGIEFSS
jgi:hypothetical protein